MAGWENKLDQAPSFVAGGSSGVYEMTNDPDVPKLWAMLKDLRAGVESGAFTPEAASEILGKYADQLVENRKGQREKK